VGFLKALVDSPLIDVGDYTYYDDPDGPQGFVERCVLYHYDFIGDRLVIGRYCAIATGVQFIMNGANHDLNGFSTYPFGIFGKGWEAAGIPGGPHRGDTVIGNDVWIGREAVFMPGVRVGNGAIVASHAVVSTDIPDYAVVAGNPARVVRMRHDADTVERLLAIGWWTWPADKVTRHLEAITGSDLARLEQASDE
jgi:virginiamycin A acetyltransferase